MPVRVRVVAVVLAAFAPLAGRVSLASALLCPGPAFEVLWTFPSPGQRDVPTNAQFWWKTRGLIVSATLNGEPLAIELFSRFAVVRAPSPKLEPNTAYRLITVHNGLTERGGESQRFEVVIDFTTGNGPAAGPPPAPVVHGHTAIPPSAHECANLIDAQGCYDAGRHGLMTFDVEVGTEIAWLFGTYFGPRAWGTANAWPASCGRPTLYMAASVPPCTDFYAIGPAGQLSEPSTYCARPEDSGLESPCHEVIPIMPWGALGKPEEFCERDRPSPERDASVDTDAAVPGGSMGDAAMSDAGGRIRDAAIADAGEPNPSAPATDVRAPWIDTPDQRSARAPEARAGSGCAIAVRPWSGSAGLAWLASLAVLALRRRRRTEAGVRSTRSTSFRADAFALPFVLFAAASCYLTHEPSQSGLVPEGAGGTPARDPGDRPRWQETPPPERPRYRRPDLPPIECTVTPTPDCSASFPRIMIVMDASSSMLAGRTPGGNNWDKARFALTGDPDAPGSVVPAFGRPLMVRGNLVTIEDVIHLGMIVFNLADVQRLVLQYTPCATDNLSWAMDPYTSCEPPGCVDPYVGMPQWTFKNSDVHRDPPFVATTHSYMPPCNPDGVRECVGNVFNTYTAEGLQVARENFGRYLRDPGRFEVDPSTRFANILITDGETSPGSLPEPVLQQLAREGVPTYVIGLQPEGLIDDPAVTLAQLDRYARAGGTEFATLIEATQRDIADAFAEAVTRIIDDLGTDPCCRAHRCHDDPEPAPR
jgi:hypothetical protein